MKIELIYMVVLWLNAFPVRNGISSVYSPRELVVRFQMDFKKHCRVLFGEYCEVHDEPEPSNSMVARTHEAIALRPTGNWQGSVKFFCLDTERVLKRRAFDIIPMPRNIIERVNAIGLREKQGRDFVFADRTRAPFAWNDEVPMEDEDFQGLLEEAPFPDVPADLPGVALDDEQLDAPVDAVEEEPLNEGASVAATLENANISPGVARTDNASGPALEGSSDSLAGAVYMVYDGDGGRRGQRRCHPYGGRGCRVCCGRCGGANRRGGRLGCRGRRARRGGRGTERTDGGRARR